MPLRKAHNMARFDPNDYSTVAERLQQFWRDYPEGRIVTQIVHAPKKHDDGDWIVQAIVYSGKEGTDLPRATGAAKQTYGEGLEVAETSAVGRALAVFNYSGNKKLGSLASREEMEQFEKEQKKNPGKRDWTAETNALADIETARQLYNEARTQKATNDVLEAIKAKVASFGPATA